MDTLAKSLKRGSPQGEPAKRAIGAVGTAKGLDAATLWLRGVVASAEPDPARAEEILMTIPALVGLCLFKSAQARVADTTH